MCLPISICFQVCVSAACRLLAPPVVDSQGANTNDQTRGRAHVPRTQPSRPTDASAAAAAGAGPGAKAWIGSAWAGLLAGGMYGLSPLVWSYSVQVGASDSVSLSRQHGMYERGTRVAGEMRGGRKGPKNPLFLYKQARTQHNMQNLRHERRKKRPCHRQHNGAILL